MAQTTRTIFIPVLDANRSISAQELPDNVLRWVLWDINEVLAPKQRHPLMQQHPWVKWVQLSEANWMWLYGYARLINKEFKRRTGIRVGHNAFLEIQYYLQHKDHANSTTNPPTSMPCFGTVPKQFAEASNGNCYLAHKLYLLHLEAKR